VKIKERLESQLKTLVNQVTEEIINLALDDARNELIDTILAQDITLEQRRKLMDLKETMLQYISNALQELENRIKVQLDLYRSKSQNKFQTLNNIRHTFRVYRSRIQTILFTELHRIYIHTKYYLYLDNNTQYIEVGPGTTEIDRKLRGIYPIERTPLPPFHPNCTVDIHPVTGEVSRMLYRGDEVLVDRLRDVLRVWGEGMGVRELAERLGLSVVTTYKVLRAVGLR